MRIFILSIGFATIGSCQRVEDDPFYQWRTACEEVVAQECHEEDVPWDWCRSAIASRCVRKRFEQLAGAPEQRRTDKEKQMVREAAEELARAISRH
jgi:hypothetical protein